VFCLRYLCLFEHSGFLHILCCNPFCDLFSENKCILYHKMKSKKYHTVRTCPQSNRKVVETEFKSIPLTHIYDLSLKMTNSVFCGLNFTNHVSAHVFNIFIKQRHVQTFWGIIHICQAILETGSGRKLSHNGCTSFYFWSPPLARKIRKPICVITRNIRHGPGIPF
jgi:hypothetical protein